MAEPTHAPTHARGCTLTDYEAVASALTLSGSLSEQSRYRVAGLVKRFSDFSDHAFGIRSLAEMRPEIAEAFVRAPSSAGEPSVATMHLRRSGDRCVGGSQLPWVRVAV